MGRVSHRSVEPQEKEGILHRENSIVPLKESDDPILLAAFLGDVDKIQELISNVFSDASKVIKSAQDDAEERDNLASTMRCEMLRCELRDLAEKNEVLSNMLHEFGWKKRSAEGWQFVAWLQTDLTDLLQKLEAETLAIVNLKSSCGTTPLMMAVQGNDVDAVQHLLNAKAKVDDTNNRDCSALMFAARYGYYKCAKALVDGKANVGLREKDGWSAMMYAARHGYANITQLLLMVGTSVVRKETLDLLEKLQLDSVIDFLIEQLVETQLIMVYVHAKGTLKVELQKEGYQTKGTVVTEQRAVNGELQEVKVKWQKEGGGEPLTQTLTFEDDKLEVVEHGKHLLPYFASIISRPGRGGKMLLESIFVEQKCPFKYREAYLPSTAPRTYMSNLRTIQMHTHGEASKKADAANSVPHETLLKRTSNEADEEKMVGALLRTSTKGLKKISKQMLGKRKSEIALFSCQIPGMVTREIVDALAEAPSLEVLDTGLARAIIQHAWHDRFQYMYLVDWLLQVLALILLCCLTSEIKQEAEVQEAEVSKYLLVFFGVLLAKSIMDELCQVYRSFKNQGDVLKYCVSFGNVVDWSRITLNCLGVRHMWQWEGTAADRGIVAAMSGMMWFRVLYGLRPFETFGPRILPILFAVKDTAAFTVVMLFCTAASTHAYFVLGARDDPNPVYASFLLMYRLIWLGDFDLYELEGEDTVFEPNDDGVLEPVDPKPGGPNYVPVQILFLIVCMLLTIAMLNLLVGILGANYERYEALSLPLFARERAGIISSLSCRFYGFCLWPKEWSGVVSEQEDSMYLWAAMKKEPDVEDVRSMRMAISRAIKDNVGSLTESQAQIADKKHQTLKDSVDEQKESLKAVKNIVDEQKKSLQLLEASVNKQGDVLQQILTKLNGLPTKMLPPPPPLRRLA